MVGRGIEKAQVQIKSSFYFTKMMQIYTKMFENSTETVNSITHI